MRRFRHLLIRRAALVAWLVACVLAVRVLVPTGYMPVAHAGGVVLGLCPGVAAPTPMAGMHHGGHEDRDPAAPGAAMPCLFAALGLSALDLSDLAVPASALVFVLAAGWVVRRSVAAAPARWRPPLRAPPRG